MSAVKMLWLGLIVLSTSGCTSKCDPVPQKCVVPSVEYPDINNTRCGEDYKCIYEKVSINYFRMKEYAEKLYISRRNYG